MGETFVVYQDNYPFNRTHLSKRFEENIQEFSISAVSMKTSA